MKLRVDIWSDIVCPWCYIGKRRFEAALAKFEHAADVEIVWRAFELDPSAPRVREEGSYAERLANKYRMPVPQAQAMIDRTTGLAAAEGLEFRFDRAKSGNTFDAHRVLHLAHERGVQDALKERLMRGYFTDGAAIGEVDGTRAARRRRRSRRGGGPRRARIRSVTPRTFAATRRSRASSGSVVCHSS